MQRFLSYRSTAGISRRQLIVVVFIGGLVVVALGMLVTRLLVTSRLHVTRGQRVDEVRYGVDRLQAAIWNVRNIDCNNDGSITDPVERWAQVTEPYRLVIYSNVDDDVAAERVRYEVVDDTLRRVVGQAKGSPCAFYDEAPQVVARSVYARSGLPLFTYLDASERVLAMPARADLIGQIAVRLLVNAAQPPASQPVEVTADITPRLPDSVAAVDDSSATVHLLVKRAGDPVDTYASSVTVAAGDEVELQWQGVGVSACTASWASEPVSVTGTIVQRPAADETFVLVCGAGDQSVSATAQVMVEGGACHCSDWIAVGCDATCGRGQQRERRSCAPVTCEVQTRCVPDPSC